MEQNVASAAPAASLLDDYRAGTSFFLSTPRRTLLANGVFAAVPDRNGDHGLDHLPRRVAAVLDHARQCGHSNPIVVGAVPFDRAAAAHLIIPNDVRWSGPLRFEAAEPVQNVFGSSCRMGEFPEPSEFVRGVRRGLAQIERGELRKIVLSRTLRLASAVKVDVRQLLRNLALRNPSGYTFAVHLPARETEPGDATGHPGRLASSGPRTWLGASPELLVSRSGRRVTANPLAGSAARSDDPVLDRQRAAALLASAKDLHEHAVVVAAVGAALRPYCRKITVPSEPSLVQTPTMWHLSSRIEGELADASTSSVELAAALHPTPAVCGTPTELAHAAIREIEPFDRGFYTGMVGWCDAAGDGEWVVAIRCAEVEERSLRLFAGAGIVAGSKAEDELAETSAKLRTMLLALGVDREIERTEEE